MHVRPALEPTTLARMLDRWALRREKVLELLDLRAATKARELARACEEFAVWRERADVTELEGHLVWLELRERIALMLGEAHGDRVLAGRPGAESGVRPAAAAHDAVEVAPPPATQRSARGR